MQINEQIKRKTFHDEVISLWIYKTKKFGTTIFFLLKKFLKYKQSKPHSKICAMQRNHWKMEQKHCISSDNKYKNIQRSEPFNIISFMKQLFVSKIEYIPKSFHDEVLSI